MGDWWNQPMRPAAPPAETALPIDELSVCPWCSAPSNGASVCPSCGAVMAQREHLGELVIPGVTDVDSNLAPPSAVMGTLHVQSVQNRMAVAASPSAAGAAVAVGAAAVLTRDALAGTFQTGASVDDVGRPSDAAVAMLRQLEADTSRLPDP